MLETDGQCKCGEREEQGQKGGEGVFGVNTLLATASCTRLSGRFQEMLTGVTPGQTSRPKLHKCRLDFPPKVQTRNSCVQTHSE